MSIEIIRTYPDQPEFHLFKKIKKVLYSEDVLMSLTKDYVEEDNLISCFIILRYQVPVGRASLYHNPHMKLNGDSTACIGHYECIQNSEISKALIGSVIEYAQHLHVKHIVGPVNGSTWNNYRFNVENKFPNFFLEPYNHPYYNEQFIDAGFEIISEYISCINTNPRCLQDQIIELEKKLYGNGLKFRKLAFNNLERDLELIHQLVVRSFSENFLYTPIHFEKFAENYLTAISVIDPDYFIMAEDFSDNLIGFVFAYEDRLNIYGKTLVVKTIARDNSKKWSGLGLLMSNQLTRTAIKNNVATMIYAFMKSDAPSTYISQIFNGQSYKKYHLYGKKLSHKK